MTKLNREMASIMLMSVNAAAPIDTTHNVDVKADCLKWLSEQIAAFNENKESPGKKAAPKKQTPRKNKSGK